ncbi:kinase [Streptomyces sp. NPDC096080]|uniref:kinase n=1 Tax=Streptomyces sp. NPDC096080 TaxID=3156693 RepID=UPI003329A81B
MKTGTSRTRLIVLRGNSASGKSSVAAALRARTGRGIALVGQDTVRRTILRERDLPGGLNIGLIDLTTRHALDGGYHVVVEGILHAGRYGAMLAGLRADHVGRTHQYYLDVPLAETLVRHAGKPIAAEVDESLLRAWYLPLDLLPGGVETVIGPDSSLERTVERVLRDTGLAGPR